MTAGSPLCSPRTETCGWEVLIEWKNHGRGIPRTLEGSEIGMSRIKISNEVLLLLVTRSSAFTRQGWLRFRVIKGW